MIQGSAKAKSAGKIQIQAVSFRLLGNGPNWECIPTNCYDWDRASLEAFDQVVGDARRTFDLLG